MPRTAPQTLSDHALAEAAECLRTLAHPTRLRMIQMLLRTDHTVGQLAEACGIVPHLASEHLRILRDRGFLKSRRRGREVYHVVIEDGLADILACIEKRFGSR